MSTGFWWSGGGIIYVLQTHFTPNKTILSIIIKCGGILLFYFFFVRENYFVSGGKKQDPIKQSTNLKNDKKIVMMITFPNLLINDDSCAVSSQYKSDAIFVIIQKFCFLSVVPMYLHNELYSANLTWWSLPQNKVSDSELFGGLDPSHFWTRSTNLPKVVVVLAVVLSGCSRWSVWTCICTLKQIHSIWCM